MRRVASTVVLLSFLPASVASASELEELMERGRDVSYTAEQIITCSTPDGVRDAVVEIEQSSGEIHVASGAAKEVQVSAGAGGWTVSKGGGVVSSAVVDSDEKPVEPLYAIEEAGDVDHLGRTASAYRLLRDGVLRAELVFDDFTGVLMTAMTFLEDGSTYCDRRFVTFDPEYRGFQATPAPVTEELAPVELAPRLPLNVAGFGLLDRYEYLDGFRFGYYSDGFFSFAVFETPVIVRLPNARRVDIDGGRYERLFTAGHATYVWETRQGGMALIGDLPPDLHETVLAALPEAEPVGIFRRLWRRLFG